MEEIEGDLLELHARRRASRGLVGAERAVLWEALRCIIGRPSDAVLRRLWFLGLILTGGGTGILYVILLGSVQPDHIGWPLVVAGCVLELGFWGLLLPSRCRCTIP